MHIMPEIPLFEYYFKEGYDTCVRGDKYYYREHYEQAIDCYNQVFEEIKTAEGWRAGENVALAGAGLGFFGLAGLVGGTLAGYFRQSNKPLGVAILHTKIAYCYYRMGRYIDAVQEAGKGKGDKKEPNSAWTYYLLGWSCMALGSNSQAITCFRIACEINPEMLDPEWEVYKVVDYEE